MPTATAPSEFPVREFGMMVLALYVVSTVVAGLAAAVVLATDHVTIQTVGVSISGGTSDAGLKDITNGAFLMTKSFIADVSLDALPGSYRVRADTENATSYACVGTPRLTFNNAQLLCTSASNETACQFDTPMVVTTEFGSITIVADGSLQPRICLELDRYGTRLYFEKIS